MHPYRDLHCWHCAIAPPAPRAVLCEQCGAILAEKVRVDLLRAMGMPLHEAAEQLAPLALHAPRPDTP